MDSSDVIMWTGKAIHVVLVFRILLGRLWRPYPLFGVFFLFLTLRSMIVFPHGDWSEGNPAYDVVYWWAELFVQPLWFLLVIEVFRHTFPVGSRLRATASWSFVVLWFLLAGVFGFVIRPKMWLFDVLREVGLTVTGSLLLILFLIRYYEIPLSRNIWGMAVGAGVFHSAAIANYAAFDMYLEPFFPWWQKIRPLSFIALWVIWTWALWRYDPGPRAGPPPAERGQLAAWWEEQWKNLDLRVKRAVGNE